MSTSIAWWHKAPFVRLFIWLTAGIVLQWYGAPAAWISWTVFSCGILISFLFQLLPVQLKFRYRLMSGLAISAMLVAGGALLVHQHDLRKKIPDNSARKTYCIARLTEPLTEKTNSFKALAKIRYVGNDRNEPGQVIIYFKKDTTLRLQYGSRIIFKKPLQEIRNSGNPGAFDYKRYCLFNGITGQVYLAPGDFEILPVSSTNTFYAFLLSCRQWVIGTLQRHINGPKEQGLAEALLIGYKEDLDKDLVQAYANTGTVHVIAISGLHLGLIYWLLMLLTKPLQRKKGLPWIRLLIVLGSMWLFSILAGAQPSVLRSAVMFSFIAWGAVINRKTSVYNSLALSAFLLLCHNPFWLWDIGFQLSYAAVGSIVAFYKPISNWCVFNNKLLRHTWQLLAVTLAAQLLTLPVSIYHFHQFPLLFLFTNIVAVPLSSIILMGEIGICALWYAAPVASWCGAVLTILIRLMNQYIELMNRISFAVWTGISINGAQTIALTVFIVTIACWLMTSTRWQLYTALTSVLFFMMVRSSAVVQTAGQAKIIVYNVDRYRAMDLFYGNKGSFFGDSAVQKEASLRNFHLQPSRVLHRIEAVKIETVKEIVFCGKHVIVIDTSFRFSAKKPKPHVDLLVLSKNPRIWIADLSNAFAIQQIVIDGTVPAWKAGRWKADCDSLGIPVHDVSAQGAFQWNLEP